MSETVLERLHQSLLLILDEIDRICRKHHIQYFLDSGTALGAVRHGGFIPWDDDADVGMLRAEYERFLRVAADELDPQFFLQTRETDPDFFKFSAKIRLNNTFFPEERNEGTSVHQGIFVDIFPFDYINDDEKKAISDIKKSRRLYMLWGLRHRHPQNERFFRKGIRAIMRIIPEDSIERKCITHFQKYNDKPTNTLVSYSYKMNGYMILYFKRDDMYPSTDIQFENRQYMIMNHYDAYLKRMYGDYMQLPPEEKRKWHFDGDIRFD